MFMSFKYVRIFCAAAAAMTVTVAGLGAQAVAQEHGGQEGHGDHHHAAPTDQGELAHQPGAHPGQRTLCPIMGGEFEVNEDSPSAQYEGQTVYFCCPGCVSEFEADPEGSLAGLTEKIDAANAERATDAE